MQVATVRSEPKLQRPLAQIINLFTHHHMGLDFNHIQFGIQQLTYFMQALYSCYKSFVPDSSCGYHGTYDVRHC